MNEWTLLLVGGGGIASLIVGVLTFYTNYNGSKINWYDRIEKDNIRLRKELKEADKENNELKSKVLQLRIIVNKLRMEKRDLIKKIERYTGGK